MPDILILRGPGEVLGAFALSALVILAAGTRLSSVADRLADRTGLGEALVGSVLLGAATSLSGLVTSVAAAADGLPSLAVSNSLGGIAAQTLFLAAADIAHRRANLEHAAASLENLLQGTVLLGALSLLAMAIAVPDLSVLGVHPVSVIVIGFYLVGLKTTQSARAVPGWRARLTAETRADEPDPAAAAESARRLGGEFLLLALVTALAGFVVSRAAAGATQTFGLTETVAGGLLAALVTSLPELVTTVASVRRGALTLAVGGIIGGNAFDILFVAASDFAYPEGPIFAAIGPQQLFQIGLASAMTAVVVMGLLRRQERGPAGIGFETWVVIALYLGGSAMLLRG